MYEIAIKTLFSKAELFLLRNQHEPFVVSDFEKKARSDRSDSDESIVNELFEVNDSSSKYKITLLRGIRPQAFDPSYKHQYES